MNKKSKQIIIAIDGPSGAGKSTLSRRLADCLEYINIDTGAMYRCVALTALQQKIDPDNPEQLGDLARLIDIDFRRGAQGERVMLNGVDVTDTIRTPEVSLMTSRIAAVPSVREAMVEKQRAMGEGGGVVLEGRDIGSVVFPRADVKFFLIASAEERGRRRHTELAAKGIDVDLQQTIAEVEERDAADSQRTHSPLRRTEDAVLIDSDNLSIDEVLSKMMAVIEQRMAGDGPGGRESVN